MRNRVIAFVIGTCISAAAFTGSTLLLYTGPRFLRATGILITLILGALALGVWAGGPSETATRRRWVFHILALITAGVFASFWTTSDVLRMSPGAGAIGALLLLALPAYASGALLAGLPTAGTGIAALAGAAAGVLLTTSVLIPRLDADVIFFSLAGASLVARIWHDIKPARTRGRTMTDRTVLVTGVGNPGQVGYALARAFRDAGANVVICDVSPGVQDLAKELGVAALQADLTNVEEVERLIGSVRERIGRLDVLVNAAGGLSVIKSVEETSIEEWRREEQRNAETAFLVSKAALPLLREARGAIINFASPAGFRAAPQMAAYSAAKAAVIALTRALAIEERDHGVRVNAIAPGMIDTEQNRRSVPDPESVRWVSRDDIASVVLFLAGDASAAVTGETIHVLGTGIE